MTEANKTPGKARVEVVDGVTVFYLAYPFETHHGKKMEKITLRRFTLADDAALKGVDDVTEIINKRLLQSTELSPEDLNRIDRGDVAGIVETIESFLDSTVKQGD